jgi:uncharacterized membrane protein YkvA (DUF1232 family)
MSEEGTGSASGEQAKNVLLFLPRLAFLVTRLIGDSEVALADKALLGAAMVYVASPLDFIPDFIPGIGQLDDIYLLALVLLRLLNRSGEAKLRQHWDGPEDIVAILNRVTDAGTRFLPGPVRDKLRSWIEAKASPSGTGSPPPGDPIEPR